jgi:uncharacterized protein (TIGR03435 family)
MLAYGVADDHISGPGWLDSETYNITAKAVSDKLKALSHGSIRSAFTRL